MRNDSKLSSLDVSVLDAVIGGNGPVLTGRAAERLYNRLTDLRNGGDPRVTGTGITTAGGPHITLSAPITCSSVGLDDKMEVSCSLTD